MTKRKISAEIIADSKNSQGDRITSFVLTFPRHILAELNTHRLFSRNSASSRAIPFKKMVESVDSDPFIPIAWQKEHKGMQGSEYITDNRAIEDNIERWINASHRAIGESQELSKGATFIEWEAGEDIGHYVEIPDTSVTKQITNRMLEPYMWHQVILTATEFENFFNQRCPQYHYAVDLAPFKSKKDWTDRLIKDGKSVCEDNSLESYGDIVPQSELEWHQHNKGQGEIHIMALAECMWDAMNESKPKELEAGQWHIPFGDKIDKDGEFFGFSSKDYEDRVLELSIQIAIARCARVSYGNFEGTDDYSKDIALYERLSKMSHFSPFEHIAKVMSASQYKLYSHSYLLKSLTEKVRGDKEKGKTSTTFIESEDAFHVTEYGWCRNYRGFIQVRSTIDQ